MTSPFKGITIPLRILVLVAVAGESGSRADGFGKNMTGAGLGIERGAR